MSGAKYSTGPDPQVDLDCTVSLHARRQYRERLPSSAPRPVIAAARAVRDEAIASHAHWHERTEAVRVYGEGAADGGGWTVVFPEVENTLTTAYLVESLYDHKTALKAYLCTLGDESGGRG